MLGRNTTPVVVGLAFILLISMAISVNNSYNRFLFFEQRLLKTWKELDEQLRAEYLLSVKAIRVAGVCFREKELVIAEMELPLDKTPEPGKNGQGNLVQEHGGLYFTTEKILDTLKSCGAVTGNQDSLKLLAEFSKEHEKTATTAKKYNEYVDGYNAAVDRFPDSIVARAMSIQKKPYLSHFHSK